MFATHLQIYFETKISLVIAFDQLHLQKRAVKLQDECYLRKARKIIYHQFHRLRDWNATSRLSPSAICFLNLGFHIGVFRPRCDIGQAAESRGVNSSSKHSISFSSFDSRIEQFHDQNTYVARLLGLGLLRAPSNQRACGNLWVKLTTCKRLYNGFRRSRKSHKKVSRCVKFSPHVV